jgi:hypothetical protein
MFLVIRNARWWWRIWTSSLGCRSHICAKSLDLSSKQAAVDRLEVKKGEVLTEPYLKMGKKGVDGVVGE